MSAAITPAGTIDPEAVLSLMTFRAELRRLQFTFLKIHLIVARCCLNAIERREKDRDGHYVMWSTALKV